MGEARRKWRGMTIVRRARPVAWLVESYWKGRPAGEPPRVWLEAPHVREMVGIWRGVTGDLTYRITPLYAGTPLRPSGRCGQIAEADPSTEVSEAERAVLSTAEEAEVADG